MKTFSVKSLPIDEVIKDLAKELNVEYVCNCDEYYMELPQDFGKGFVQGIMFDTGIGLINYEVEWAQDTEIHFEKNEVHPVKCIFCYEGRVDHYFANERQTVHEIDLYQNSIVASQSKNGHVLFFKKGEVVKLNSIEIDRKKFLKKFNCPLESLPPELYTLFSEQNPKQNFYYNGQYSIEISDIIYRMRVYEGNNFLRRIYIEGKGLEMFSLQLDQYIDDLNVDSNRTVFRKNEIQSIINAATYLKENIKNSITVAELASYVGLNENKLQAGFRYLFRTTVNGFIQDFRLEEAGRLLLAPEHNITEVSDMVGITSKSYFSKMFKEKFGMSPKSFQQKYGMNH